MPMEIIILGAGTVGTSIAETLCHCDVSVTLVDRDPAQLSRAGETLDVQALEGDACSAATLFKAGVLGADLCMAVTGRDEVNLVAASVARAMGAGRTVARIFDPNFREYSTFDYQRHFAVDRLLSLEYLTAIELAKALNAPGLQAVENFARGGVQVQEVAVDDDSKIVGQSLRELSLPSQVRAGLIDREGRPPFIPGADDRIETGDHVILVGAEKAIEEARELMERRRFVTRQQVAIAGGGEVGYHLARSLSRTRFDVRILEANPKRAEFLAEKLPDVLVLNADSTRRADLLESRVPEIDTFIAAMGHDEDNIVCGVEAKELGAERTLCVVRRPDYANVLQKLGIDKAVSPREVMAREVTGMVVTSPVLARSTLVDGEAEVCELEVLPGAAVEDRTLKELAFEKALVAALSSEGFVKVPGPDDKLTAGCTAIVLTQREATEPVIDQFRVR